MKVARWGHALAVRLPAELVEKLGLVEGDEITLVPNRQGAFDVAFAQRHERTAEWLRTADPRDNFDPKVFFDMLEQEEMADQGSTADRP